LVNGSDDGWLEDEQVVERVYTGRHGLTVRHFMAVKIYRYIKKLVDIFPAEHLTQLLSSSQLMTAEELLAFYEAKKGEAKQSDYSGEPTARAIF
jgi:hypothetical protein